jgi:DNA/RNA endonuclease YhcR with UshA esterase domain
MKRIMVVLLVGAFLLAPCTSLIAAEQKTSQSSAKKAPDTPQVTVKGTVVAVGKDAKGNVNAVAVKSDKGDYKVVLKGKGKELLKMVGKKVEVTGKVREAKGKKSISISDFKEAKE